MKSHKFQTSHHRRRGFTLVEVLVGTALIGILGAVAVPSYSNYTRRTNVSGGVALAGPSQLRIAEEAIVGKSPTGGPVMAWSVGMFGGPIPVVNEVMPNSSSAMVKNIVRVETNNIVINYSPAFNATTQYSLLYKGQVQGLSMKWTCLSGAAAQPELDRYRGGGVDVGTAIPKEWAPSQCS